MKKAMAAIGLTASLMAGSCSNPEVSDRPPTTPTDTAPAPDTDIDAEADEAWVAALYRLREDIEDSAPMKLLVAREACIVWPALADYVTIVKSPVIIQDVTDSHEVDFFPFVAPGGSVMNGPFQYVNDQDEVAGTFHAVQATAGLAFEELPEAVYKPNTDAEMGWLESTNGRVAETHLVKEDSVQEAVAALCQDGQLLPLADTAQKPQRA